MGGVGLDVAGGVLGLSIEVVEVVEVVVVGFGVNLNKGFVDPAGG